MPVLMEQGKERLKGIFAMSETEAKSRKKLLRCGIILLLVIAAAVVWWLMPVRILRGCQPEDITKIEIEGVPGGKATVTDETEVRTIAENLFTCGAVKDGISYMRMGYGYKLSLYAGEKFIRSFSINSNDSARDSVFFYKPKRGDLSYCRAYLDTLAEKYQKTD